MNDAEVFAMITRMFPGTPQERDQLDNEITVRFPGEDAYVCWCGETVRPGYLYDPDGTLPTIRIFHKHQHPVMRI